jgi:hypothetical protein
MFYNLYIHTEHSKYTTSTKGTVVDKRNDKQLRKYLEAVTASAEGCVVLKNKMINIIYRAYPYHVAS